MDNQQERPVSEEFVGGLIVGEGSFNLVHVNKHKGKAGEYRPCFSIAMADRRTMQLVCEAFTRWGLAYYFYETDRKNGNKSIARIQVHGYKRVKRVLDRLLPHLTGTKREAAECLKGFIDSRMAIPGTGRWNPVTEQQKDYYLRLKAINKS